MLEFTDKPYRYYPPRPSRWVTRLMQCYNSSIYLPGRRHRIREVTVDHGEELNHARHLAGSRLLFLPNHPTHSDPLVMMEGLRQAGLTSRLMAAYDVFERSALHAWVMQRIGAFSVDREGSDRQALKEAIGTLAEGREPLTIFPEGNVYLMNDRLTPFLDGPSYIAFKAQQQAGADQPVLAVPVSIKVTHLTNQRDTLRRLLRGLAEEIDADVDSHPVEGVYRVGLNLLSRKLREHGHIPPQGNGHEPPEVLRQAAELLIERLEERMELEPREADDLVDRVRRLRLRIHQIRLSPERAEEQDLAAAWAGDAILAFRILTYAGDYLSEKPTLDRFGETVEKMLEDYRSRIITPYGDRSALMRFGRPINVSRRMADYEREPRRAMEAFTRDCERAVQEGIDQLNAANPCPGGELY
ncbi:MAG: 1-acyl-sn-glycerol-3-phosphate acyltransferase [Verrucomicrobiota bacterium]|nr:1-acyl-sn-glycerol-3-phosphate acyltransferase [Verrucomicrobiota bacterium]